MPTNPFNQKTRRGVEWGAISSFCLVAYALSWVWWSARFAPHLDPSRATGSMLERTEIGSFDVQVGMIGPLLAALIVRCFISREGLQGTIGWQRSWRVYLLAYLVPTGLGVCAILLNHFSGLGRFDWVGESLLTLILQVSLISLLASVTALGEEYGWRGYLLPRLMPLGEIRATLLTGLIWGVWHLPLLVVGLTYPGAPVPLAILVFILSTSILSFVFTWFHLLSKGSVVIAAVVHGSLNAMSELTSLRHMPNASALVVSPFGLTTSIIGIALVAVVYGIFRRPGRHAGGL